MQKEIILIGGGGHCSSCIDVIEAEGKYKILGILDLPELVGSKIMDYEIIGTDDEIKKYAGIVDGFLITVGQIKSYEKRRKLFELVKSYGGKLPLIISPHAYVSKSAKISEGTIVMHHALVNINAKVGVNCIINSKALIEHDAQIGNHCHISTGSIINGGVSVGDGTFFGSGATSVQGSVIPSKSFVKANSLFYKK